jgi:hypothetical protein
VLPLPHFLLLLIESQLLLSHCKQRYPLRLLLDQRRYTLRLLLLLLSLLLLDKRQSIREPVLLELFQLRRLLL